MKREIEIRASLVQDWDDCLTAAAEMVAEREGVEEWQVSAQWTDDDRETITVTVDQPDEDCYRVRDARGEGFSIGVEGDAVFAVVDALEKAGAEIVQRAWTDDSIAVVVTPAGRRIGIGYKNGPWNGPWACYLD